MTYFSGNIHEKNNIIQKQIFLMKQKKIPFLVNLISDCQHRRRLQLPRKSNKIPRCIIYSQGSKHKL